MFTLYGVIFLIIFTFVTIATEIEWFGWATLTLIASVIAVQSFHLFDLLLYVKDHAFKTALYSLGYICVGVVWSFAKWFFFLMNERDKAQEYINKDKHVTPFNLPVVNIPQAAHNKGKIIAWMSYWPFSSVGTILNDPIRKFFNMIFAQLKNQYQNMANNIFAVAVLENDYKNNLLLEEIKAEREKAAQVMKDKEDAIRAINNKL